MPIIPFLISAFVVAYIVQLLAIFASPGRKLNPADMGKLPGLLLVLCMFTPTIVLAIFMFLGFIPFDWHSLGILPVRPTMWALAFGITLLYQGVTFIILKQFADFPDFSVKEDGKWRIEGLATIFLNAHDGKPLHYSLDILATVIIITLFSIPKALGEELAWRGFLQGALVTEHGPIIGVVILGIIWGLWHLPANLAGLNDSKNPKLTALIFFIINTISMSAVFGWLVLFTGSVWTAAVAHAANNVLQALIAKLAPRICNIRYMCIMSLIYAIIGGIFFWLIHVTV